MGTGLIPADGEVWKVRRRAIVPALHKQVGPTPEVPRGDLEGCNRQRQWVPLLGAVCGGHGPSVRRLRTPLV